MPKETFWESSAVEGDGSEPTLTVQWGDAIAGTIINGAEFDASAIERLQAVLRRASGKDRIVNVTLTANTSAYVAGMEAAKVATQDLAEELRKSGITAEDMPTAVVSAMKIAGTMPRDAKASEQIDIHLSETPGRSSIVVDGTDITYWLTNEPFVIDSGRDGLTTIAVKLTAPVVRTTFAPLA